MKGKFHLFQFANKFEVRNVSYNIPLPFFRDVLARTYSQMGNLDKAIAEYKRLVYINIDPKRKDINKSKRCGCLISKNKKAGSKNLPFQLN